MPDAKILVADSPDLAVIKVIGRATLQISPGLQKYGERVNQRDSQQVIIDFTDCSGMDSTFMGMLTVIALPQFKKGSPVILVNASDNQKQLLKGLGVHDFFEFKALSPDECDWVNLSKTALAQDINEKEKGEMMLEAHQALMDADEANIPKFQNVVEFLQNDLDELNK